MTKREIWGVFHKGLLASLWSNLKKAENFIQKDWYKYDGERFYDPIEKRWNITHVKPLQRVEKSPYHIKFYSTSFLITSHLDFIPDPLIELEYYVVKMPPLDTPIMGWVEGWW
jgi:hypothetical protein